MGRNEWGGTEGNEGQWEGNFDFESLLAGKHRWKGEWWEGKDISKDL